MKIPEKILRKWRRKKAPVWTVIYGTWGCHHVQWGQPDGRPIPFRTILNLAQKRQDTDPKCWGKWISCIAPRPYRQRFNGSYLYIDKFGSVNQVDE